MNNFFILKLIIISAINVISHANPGQSGPLQVIETEKETQTIPTPTNNNLNQIDQRILLEIKIKEVVEQLKKFKNEFYKPVEYKSGKQSQDKLNFETILLYLADEYIKAGGSHEDGLRLVNRDVWKKIFDEWTNGVDTNSTLYKMGTQQPIDTIFQELTAKLIELEKESLFESEWGSSSDNPEKKIKALQLADAYFNLGGNQEDLYYFIGFTKWKIILNTWKKDIEKNSKLCIFIREGMKDNIKTSLIKLQSIDNGENQLTQQEKDLLYQNLPDLVNWCIDLGSTLEEIALLGDPQIWKNSVFPLKNISIDSNLCKSAKISFKILLKNIFTQLTIVNLENRNDIQNMAIEYANLCTELGIGYDEASQLLTPATWGTILSLWPNIDINSNVYKIGQNVLFAKILEEIKNKLLLLPEWVENDKPAALSELEKMADDYINMGGKPENAYNIVVVKDWTKIQYFIDEDWFSSKSDRREYNENSNLYKISKISMLKNMSNTLRSKLSDIYKRIYKNTYKENENERKELEDLGNSYIHEGGRDTGFLLTNAYSEGYVRYKNSWDVERELKQYFGSNSIVYRLFE